MSNFHPEPESADYAACRFQVNGRCVISRQAKVTPKKMGQFVTFWKRSEGGPIKPFSIADDFDLFVVTTLVGERFGQFVFLKSVSSR